jgi:hypothetical protein
MLDKWYRCLRLDISIQQFHELPRNPAYKYEYFQDHALLSPRPKNFNALLDLISMEAVPAVKFTEPIGVRPLRDDDWQPLGKLFAWAFGRVQPFAGLNEADRLQASHDCLEQTRTGGDGPFIAPASFVAERATGGHLLGAILVTLIPKRPLGEWWDGRWKDPPPADAVEKRIGRPHLTWVFVNPHIAFHGLGSALLAHSVEALLGLGFAELASTFLLGNDSSMLWHWRNGFRLAAYPGSPRVWREQMETKRWEK